MFLKKECDELGEWFADTYPLYTIDFGWSPVADKKTGRPGEVYNYTLTGPGKLNKQLALVLDFNGREDSVRTTFLSKMRTAISDVINPPDIKINEYEMRGIV